MPFKAIALFLSLARKAFDLLGTHVLIVIVKIETEIIIVIIINVHVLGFYGGKNNLSFSFPKKDARARDPALAEIEFFYRILLDKIYRVPDIIRKKKKIEVLFRDRFRIAKPDQVFVKLLVIIPAHEHHRKIFHLLCLNKRKRFKKFIQCSVTTGHHNKGVRILGK